MKLCRFQLREAPPRPGLIADGSTVLDLTPIGIESLSALFETEDADAQLARLARQDLPRHPLREVRLLAPVDRQEIWAVGVTYLRSKKARMEESDFSATAYDRVYDAARPELFFKGLPEKAVSPGGLVGIRRDATWSVPEPELALILNSRGQLAGYTIGNDMSSRDIEGENLLYLPQAKIYDGSCALGPCVTVGASEAEARTWTIAIKIRRGSEVVFQGDTGVEKIKRGFQELVGYLFRSQSFPHGAVLLTGTGIVPPDGFTLQAGDEIVIGISGIGELSNTVAVV